MNEYSPAKLSRAEKRGRKARACVCVCVGVGGWLGVCVCACRWVGVCAYVRVYVCSFSSHIHVEMDRGDVMSGIDLLNMAPSHHNDDVIHGERQTNKRAGV